MIRMRARDLQPKDVVEIDHRTYVVQTIVVRSTGTNDTLVKVAFTNGFTSTYDGSNRYSVERRKSPCARCEGTGWVCVRCVSTGARCACNATNQDAMDCQECQGTGENHETA